MKFNTTASVIVFLSIAEICSAVSDKVTGKIVHQKRVLKDIAQDLLFSPESDKYIFTDEERAALLEVDRDGDQDQVVEKINEVLLNCRTLIGKELLTRRLHISASYPQQRHVLVSRWNLPAIRQQEDYFCQHINPSRDWAKTCDIWTRKFAAYDTKLAEICAALETSGTYDDFRADFKSLIDETQFSTFKAMDDDKEKTAFVACDIIMADNVAKITSIKNALTAATDAAAAATAIKGLNMNLHENQVAHLAKLFEEKDTPECFVKIDIILTEDRHRQAPPAAPSQQTPPAPIPSAPSQQAPQQNTTNFTAHFSEYKYRYLAGFAVVAICGGGAYMFKDKLRGKDETNL